MHRFAKSLVEFNAGRSVRTLRRRFKEQGISLQKLVNQVRYQQATELLETTGMPISDIADQLGYSDTASLRHAFKR
ncbi:helix-turn-helix domain-containing protein [Vibrio alginolyticus]